MNTEKSDLSFGGAASGDAGPAMTAIARMHRKRILEAIKELEEEEQQARRPQGYDRAFAIAVEDARRAVGGAMLRWAGRLDARLQTLAANLENLRCHKPGRLDNWLSGGKKLRVWHEAVRRAARTLDWLRQLKRRNAMTLRGDNEHFREAMRGLICNRLVRRHPGTALQTLSSYVAKELPPFLERSRTRETSQGIVKTL